MIGFGLILVAALQQDVARPSVVLYAVDPRASEAGFDGRSTWHDWTARSRSLRGILAVVPDAPGSSCGGWVELDAKGLESGNGTRDDGMRERLDATRHPVLRFDATGATGSLERGRGALELSGTFNIRGIQRPRRIVTTVEPASGGGLRTAGAVRFAMSDHRVERPDNFFATVRDEVRVFFDVTWRPLPGDLVSARHVRAHVYERSDDGSGAAVQRRWSDGFYFSELGSLWESVEDSRWVVRVDDAAPTVVDLRTLSRPDAARSAEEECDELDRRIASIEQRMASENDAAKRASRAEVEHLRVIRASAPRGAPKTVALAERLVVEYGGRPWLVVDGPRAPGDVGAFIATVPGLPLAVREALVTLDGIPRTIALSSWTSRGVSRREFEFEPARDAVLPAADLAPRSFSRPRADASR